VTILPVGVRWTAAAPDMPRPYDWRDDALCAQTDPEVFHPVVKGSGSTKQAMQAKAICARCDVRTQCLEYALSADERYGVWGGLSESERRKFKRRQTGTKTEIKTEATDTERSAA
jgi:WhiB family transcriptional regulator, redox-sensing transcriptional regulator